jgi:hypothetical protein
MLRIMTGLARLNEIAPLLKSICRDFAEIHPEAYI